MVWWTWGLIAWALLATAGFFWLAVVCTVRRRSPAAAPRTPVSTDPPALGAREPQPERQPEPQREPLPEPLPEPQVEFSAGPAAPTRSTQPLDHLRPALAAVGAPVPADARFHALERLLRGARAGHYTLPPALLRATEGHHRLGGLKLPAPRPFVRADAAARLVSEATRGESLDPLALTARVHRSRSDMLVFTEAREVVAMAVEFGEKDATAVAGDLSRRIIEEHLRPAHREVLREARRVADRLAPFIERFQVDTSRIVTANRRVRRAWAELPVLVRRHRSIRAAWDALNLLGERPQHDTRNLFAFFQEPLALAPPGLSYELTPVPLPPGDDTARLLWLVSDRAARARPWLPTVAEQDAAWLSCFEGPSGTRRVDRGEPEDGAPRRAAGADDASVGTRSSALR